MTLHQLVDKLKTPKYGCCLGCLFQIFIFFITIFVIFKILTTHHVTFYVNKLEMFVRMKHIKENIGRLYLGEYIGDDYDYIDFRYAPSCWDLNIYVMPPNQIYVEDNGENIVGTHQKYLKITRKRTTKICEPILDSDGNVLTHTTKDVFNDSSFIKKSPYAIRIYSYYRFDLCDTIGNRISFE